MLRLQLMTSSGAYPKRYLLSNDRLLQSLAAKRSDLLHANPVGSASCKKMKETQKQPLVALKRDAIGPHGQPLCSITIGAHELDGILTHAWGWYAHRCGGSSLCSTIRCFHLSVSGAPSSSSFDRGGANTCMHSKNCPTGMGQCAAQEFLPFSHLAFDILAGILYAIKNCVP